MASATEKVGGKVHYRYFDLGNLGGRGTTVRFFLLAKGVDFDVELTPYDENWSSAAGGKKQLVESGVNPAGFLPVLKTASGQVLTEHHAILRRFSRQLGLYGQDLERDYQADVLADNSVEWRNKWVASLFGEPGKSEYAKFRPEIYSIFETFLGRFAASGGHAVGNAPSFVDSVLFGLLYDDQEVAGDDLLQSSPKLKEFYQSYGQQPKVKEWVDAHTKRE